MGTPRVVQGDERLAYTAGTTVENVAPVGTKLVIEDGRTFRMTQCDTSTALVNARLVSSPAPSANFRDEEVDTIAAGEFVLTDPGATSGDATVDQFRGGYLTVTEAAQLDPIHRIKSNGWKPARLWTQRRVKSSARARTRRRRRILSIASISAAVLLIG